MSLPSIDTLMKKICSLSPDRLAEVEDFVEFIKQRNHTIRKPIREHTAFDFPVDRMGNWPKELSLHREDMYGDEGR